jgi:hypothetical protein
MTIETKQDSKNNRIVHINTDEAGLFLRSNIITFPGQIEMHTHSYDHVFFVLSGWFMAKVIDPAGNVTEEFQVASSEFRTTNPMFNSRGNRGVIPAEYKHMFTLLEAPTGVGEICCVSTSDCTYQKDQA